MLRMRFNTGPPEGRGNVDSCISPTVKLIGFLHIGIVDPRSFAVVKLPIGTVEICHHHSRYLNINNKHLELKYIDCHLQRMVSWFFKIFYMC